MPSCIRFISQARLMLELISAHWHGIRLSHVTQSGCHVSRNQNITSRNQAVTRHAVRLSHVTQSCCHTSRSQAVTRHANIIRAARVIVTTMPFLFHHHHHPVSDISPSFRRVAIVSRPASGRRPPLRIPLQHPVTTGDG